MDLRIRVCVFCFANVFVHAQTFLWNQSIHQPIQRSGIDFGYRNYFSKPKEKFLQRLDSTYLLSYLDSGNLTLAFSPLLHISGGTNLGNGSGLFQNSRGALMVGGGTRFKCHAIILETQALFPTYQTNYILQHGEFYPSNSGYIQQNGMVPSGGRTKPYKTAGFDYAYALGGFEWKIRPLITVFGGNQSYQFTPGFRSVFWSDHNQATQIGALFKLTRRLTYFVTRSKLIDLVRHPQFANVESPYCKKGFSQQALFLDLGRHHLGYFYQNIWQGSDSLSNQVINPWFWVPLPLLDRIVDKKVSLPQIGMNYTFHASPSWVLYSELFTRGFAEKAWAGQIGTKYFRAFQNDKTISAHVSYNRIGESFYGTTSALAFSHQNLPLGSVLGNGGQEILFNLRGALNRVYIEYLFQSFRSYEEKTITVVPAYNPPLSIQQHHVEVGFILSRISQLCAFIGYLHRFEDNSLPFQAFQLGLKTSLFKANNVY